ncbi:hypothetical protein [Larkinella soli]|uniref:hypothetical protein n=1 Tax=Larkinella soli TaxID=1770527 RepID=UPI0013E34D79|nr:hypothetical protein [Larkinella soli]
MGRVADSLLDGYIIPYQLNLLEERGRTVSVRTRIVGDRHLQDGTHVYNPAAKVRLFVSLGNIAQGAGPPAPFDQMVDIVNYWAEFRSLPLPAAVQQGGFMRPSPEFYALLGYIVITL